MPARCLTDETLTVHPFDVLAQVHESSNLPIHALLCDEGKPRHDVSTRTPLRCVHMGPPFGSMQVHCHAVASAGLEESHRMKIKTFVYDRRKERDAHKARLSLLGSRAELKQEYRIHPPATPPDANFPLWRFSCVGFVLKAYEAARIRLLDAEMPPRSVEDLKRFYPWAASQLDDAGVRQRLGLGDGVRWPVALVGYVLNSMARQHSEIHTTPHVAQAEFFPR